MQMQGISGFSRTRVNKPKIHVYPLCFQSVAINCCKEKSEWVETTPGATTQDFIEQKAALDEILSPILLKLTEPRMYL